MQPEVREYIIGLTDDSLVEYLQAGTTMYGAEAVEIARQVMADRRIGPERLKELEAIVEERRIAETARLAEIGNRPLGWMGRTLAFLGGLCGIFPFLLCYLVAWFHLRSRSERRKVRDLWKFALTGLVSLPALLLLLTLLI